MKPPVNLLRHGASMPFGLGIVAAVLMAGALVQIRKLTKMGEQPVAIAFYFAFTGSALGAMTVLFNWTMPYLTQTLFLIDAGLAGGFAHIFMTVSFKYAKAST